MVRASSTRLLHEYTWLLLPVYVSHVNVIAAVFAGVELFDLNDNSTLSWRALAIAGPVLA